MRFELHLNDKEDAKLIETVYDSGSGVKLIKCVGRTIKDMKPCYQGSFKWSAGIQAFTYFFLKWAAWGRCKNGSLPEPVIKGKKGSLASTLNNFLSRREIPCRIFGISEDFLFFFSIVNRDFKTDRKGPIIITLDYKIFSPENILVIVGDEELCDHDEIDGIAESVRKKYFPEETKRKKGKAEKQIVLGNPPPPPELFIGRDNDLENIKVRLGIIEEDSSSTASKFTVIRGWPGVGKSTFVAALANDLEVIKYFSSGILWTSLGQNASILSEMIHWGRVLGCDYMSTAQNIKQAADILARVIADKKMLLIIDDVWETAHAMAFKLGSSKCHTVFTTRLPAVAEALASIAGKACVLEQLGEEDSLNLLSTHAPNVVEMHEELCRQLIKELEGLPLALRVAGRLLNVEAGHHWGIKELLIELREDVSAILKSEAPADMADIARETTSTVSVLLKKSTNRLEEHTRECFSMLGAFAPKPATFDVNAMAYVWEVKDPKPIIRELVARGLLEPAENGRYQIHALLVSHAKSLLNGMSSSHEC